MPKAWNTEAASRYIDICSIWKRKCVRTDNQNLVAMTEYCSHIVHLSLIVLLLELYNPFREVSTTTSALLTDVL